MKSTAMGFVLFNAASGSIFHRVTSATLQLGRCSPRRTPRTKVVDSNECSHKKDKPLQGARR